MTNGLPALAHGPAQRVSQATVWCVVVAVNGLIEAGAGWLDLDWVGDMTGTPDLSASGSAVLAAMALHLLLGLAAFGFAALRRLRLGLAALALAVLARWAGQSPLLIRHAVDLTAGINPVDVIVVLFKAFGQPVVCAGALAAAWLNRGLPAATVAMAVSTVINYAEMALFALAVTLFGI